jgi:hypothetical protein
MQRGSVCRKTQPELPSSNTGHPIARKNSPFCPFYHPFTCIIFFAFAHKYASVSLTQKTQKIPRRVQKLLNKPLMQVYVPGYAKTGTKARVCAKEMELGYRGI